MKPEEWANMLPRKFFVILGICHPHLLHSFSDQSARLTLSSVAVHVVVYISVRIPSDLREWIVDVFQNSAFKWLIDFRHPAEIAEVCYSECLGMTGSPQCRSKLASRRLGS